MGSAAAPHAMGVPPAAKPVTPPAPVPAKAPVNDGPGMAPHAPATPVPAGSAAH
jgi:hypothetical protein